jgi:hypothetical protein
MDYRQGDKELEEEIREIFKQALVQKKEPRLNFNPFILPEVGTSISIKV